MDIEKCLSCKFWKFLQIAGEEEFHEEDRQGACRRYPPKLDLSEADNWAESHNGYTYLDYRFWNHPVTQGGQWCGEWRMNNA